VVPPKQLPPPPEPVFCTMEAQLCPDGSSVGRTGPNCEFAPCPPAAEPSVDSKTCASDGDCVCGGFDARADKCFVGNRNYYDLFVNKTRDCPDFCSGIANNLETKCVQKECVIMTRKPVARVDLIASHGFIVAPTFVEFNAHLSGPAPAHFDCARIKWNFGDTLSKNETVKCAIPAGAAMDKDYKISHKYLRPGNYTATFAVDGMTSSAFIVAYPTIAPPECDQDSDCVPAQCCHAGDCIIKEKRADCSRTLCSEDCRPGTLDCGGSCACVSNRCTGKKFYPGIDVPTGPRPWAPFPS